MSDNHKGGMPLIAINGEFSLSSSSVPTILKNKEYIKTAAIATTNLKMTIMIKKHEGPLSEMEKLLAKRIRICIDKDLLSLEQIQKNVRSLFEDMKRKY